MNDDPAAGAPALEWVDAEQFLQFTQLPASVVPFFVLAGYSNPSGANFTAGAPAIDQLIAVPFVVYGSHSYNRLGFVHTVNGGAGSQVQLGVYKDNGSLYPGAQALTTLGSKIGATFSTATGATASPSPPRLALFPGGWELSNELVWLAYHTGSGTAPTIATLLQASIINMAGLGEFSTLPPSLRIALPYAVPLPDPVPTGAASNTQVPLLMMEMLT